MKKLISMLAITGALFNMSFAHAQSEPQSQGKCHAKITAKTTAESRNVDYAQGDVILTPTATAQIGDAVATYTGTFRKATDTDGKTGDWETWLHKLSLANDTWGLTVGRSSLRNFNGTTTSIGFDNALLGKGLGRTFTGSFVNYEPFDLTLGVAATDGEINPTHWDMLLSSWSHRFDDTLGIQVMGGVTKDHVEKAGLAIEYKPTENTSILLDGVYGRSKSVGMLGANFKLLERLKLFAGSEITIPDKGHTTGTLIGGMEGNVGHGVSLIGAVQQGLGSEHETQAILGFKLSATGHLL